MRSLLAAATTTDLLLMTLLAALPVARLNVAPARGAASLCAQGTWAA